MTAMAQEERNKTGKLIEHKSNMKIDKKEQNH